MIGTIRKHQTILWWVVIAATIVGFVIYFNPSSQYTQGRSSGPVAAGNYGSLFGQPVTAQEYQTALGEARIFYRLQANEWPTTQAANEQIEDIAHNFLLISAELKHNQINVTPDAAARFTKHLIGLKPNEPLSKDGLEQVLGHIFAGSTGDATPNDFYNFVHLQAGQQYLTAIFGMTGQLITPKEAESFYRRDNEPMLTQVAVFPASNYDAFIMPTTNEIEDFYTKREAQYRIPEQLVLNYVEFPLTNFMAAADKTLAQQLGTNLDTRIDELYVQQDPSSYRDETGTNILSAAAAKARIKLELRKKQALIEARKSAVDFANQLLDGHDDQHPFTPGDIFTTAKKLGVAVHTTRPFDQKNGPQEINLEPREIQMLFNLSANDPDDKDHSRLYLSSPLATLDGVYVVGLKDDMPSRIPPLSQIHDQVVADYRHVKSLEMAQQAGQRFEDALKKAGGSAKSFQQLCAEHNVKTLNLPGFAMTSNSIPGIEDRAESQQIQAVAYNMATGKVSPFVPTAQGGFILYLRERLPVDESKMREQMPTLLDRMREQREVEAFTQWLGREAQLHAVFPARNPAGAAAG